MKLISEHKEGFWGTVVFHTIVIILLCFFGFFTPLPLPEEEGVLVNFGNSQNGLGEEEPAAGTPAAATATEVASATETAPAPIIPATPPPAQKTSITPVPQVKEEILTQDYEKTVALETAKKKKEEEAKKKQQDLEKKQAQERQQELDRQKKLDNQKKAQELEQQRKLAAEAEIERQKQAELERQRKAAAEAERLRKEAEAAKIAQINNRAAGAFGSGSGGNSTGTGSGAGTSNSKSTGQGVTFPGGNQGSPNGGNSNNYGTGGTGTGSQGSGPSFSLAGRKATGLPKPSYPGNEEGVVVVSITVDKNGRVTSAKAGEKGSNTYNAGLLEAARQAALKSSFNADPGAAALQSGTITYRFVLD
ncbi:MAG: TonB family protein [Mangrovibacterium sp.]